MEIIEAQVLIRRDTAAALAAVVPDDGEPTYEKDTKLQRIGDGVTRNDQLDAAAWVDGATHQFSNTVRARIAANLADPTTPEGSALASLIANSGLANAKAPFIRALGTIATAPLDIAVVGDSNSEGAGQSTLAGRWINKMLAALRGSYQPSGVAGGVGYIPIGYMPNTLPSPWNYALNPGVAAIALDNFARTASTLDGTLPDIGPNAWGGGTTNYTLNGTDVVTASNSAVAYLQTGSTVDRLVKIIIGVGATAPAGAANSNPVMLYWSFKDANNWLRVIAPTWNTTTSTWQIEQSVGGTRTVLATFSTAPVAPGATNLDFGVSIAVSGTSVTAVVNGATLTASITASDKAAVLGTNTGMRVGLQGGFVRSYEVDPANATPGVLTLLGDYGLGRRNMIIGPVVDCVSASMSFTGTAIDVIVTKTSQTGTLSVSIDGGSAQTFDTKSATVQNGVAYRLAGLAAGSHTVTVTAAAGQFVNVEGVFVQNGDSTSGLRLWDAARYGAQTSTFSGTPAWANSLAAVNPDVTIIALGVNDYQAGVSIATFTSNLQAIISAVRQASPTGMIVLQTSFQRGDVSNPSVPWPQYVAAIKGLAATNPGAILWDLDAQIGGPTVRPENASLWGSDLVHFSNAGQDTVSASAVAAIRP